MPGDLGRGAGNGVPATLLTSKLAAPPLPDPAVERPRLLDALDRAVAGPVTLVAAPAGWGKTVLLGSWFRARRAGRAVAWLSVEPADTGARFWSYLHAALDPLVTGLPDPGTGEPGPEYVERVAAALAGREEPVVLVVDDLHQLPDPGSLAAVEFLLRHADERLRLVIGARAEPPLGLHRFRVSGELTELRRADLAFTADEVADLLTAHGVFLPPADVPGLAARTEGWPAALRLAALALRGHPDPARFVEHFTGDRPDVADYLTGEVLGGLDDELRGVLRYLAVAEPVTGGLLDALTGRTDGDRLLDELQRRTGFVTALDDVRPVAYRCHRLLADLLRAELERRPATERHELHRRAADWYAREQRPVDALDQALAAGDWRRAVALLLDRWPELVPYDRDDLARPVAVAPPAGEVAAEPALALALAAQRLRAGEAAGATALLERPVAAEAASPQSRRAALHRAREALELCRARLSGDPVAARAAAGRLLRLADRAGAEDAAARAVARTGLGLVELGAGRLGPAATEFSAGVAEADRAGLTRVALVADSRLALITALRGELRAAERHARAALARPPCQGRPCRLDCAFAYLALALVALHRDRPEEAAADLGLAGWPAQDGYAGGLTAVAALCRAELLRDRGDPVTACQVLAEGRAALAGAPPAELEQWLRAAEAELRAGHGEVDRARDLLRSAQEPVAAVALARVELYAGGTVDVSAALPRWDAPAAEDWPLPVRLEAGLLDALAARRRGDDRRATAVLERVLALAEPEGLRRVFVRGGPEVRDLLVAHLDSGTAYWTLLSELVQRGAAPEEPRAAAPAVLGEPLTDRELTILRYLQSILSNVEIAGELSLSVNTVKTHVRNIYRKLNATRRREAVRRARELRLI